MGFLPNLCCIKYKYDNLTTTNNSQKSEFQDKGGEEINKVKENIPKTLVGNMTAVVIRAMTEAIKGEGEEKGKGSKEKEGIGYIVSVWIHISVSCLRVYAFFSFFFFGMHFRNKIELLGG